MAASGGGGQNRGPSNERTVVVLNHGYTGGVDQLINTYTAYIQKHGISDSIESVVSPVSSVVLGLQGSNTDKAATFTFSSVQGAHAFCATNKDHHRMLPNQMFCDATLTVKESDINTKAPQWREIASRFGLQVEPTSNHGYSRIQGKSFRIQAIQNLLQTGGSTPESSETFDIDANYARVLMIQKKSEVYPKCFKCDVRITIPENGTSATVVITGGKDKLARAQAKVKVLQKAEKGVKKISSEKVEGQVDKEYKGVAFVREQSPAAMTMIGKRSSLKRAKKKMKKDKKKEEKRDVSSNKYPQSDNLTTSRHPLLKDTTDTNKRTRELWTDLAVPTTETVFKPTPSPTKHSSTQPMTFISCKNNNIKLHVLNHDITKMAVDVIVNAANGQLDHGSGVARAIAEAAGSEMNKDCRRYFKNNGPIAVTHNTYTGPGQLSCHEIMHAVGPIYDGSSPERAKHSEQQLFCTIKKCLNSAQQRNYQTIAIPAISSGAFGFPGHKVAEVIIDSLCKFLANSFASNIQQIYLVDVRDEMIQYLQSMCSSRPTDLKLCDQFEGNCNGELIGMARSSPSKSPQSGTSRPAAAATNPYDQHRTADPVSSPHRTPEHMTNGSPLPEFPARARPSPSKPSTIITQQSFASIKAKGAKLHILVHDITQMKVDVIVNAANKYLRHETGVAKAIAKAAGQQMVADCAQHIQHYGNVSVEEVVQTNPGRLTCKWVFHAVGPLFDGRNIDQHKSNLYNTIWKCLSAASKQRFKSIVFPTISAGASKTPADIVTEVIADSICHFLSQASSSLQQIYIVDVTDTIIQHLINTFSQRTADVTKLQSFEGNWKGELGYDSTKPLIDMYQSIHPSATTNVVGAGAVQHTGAQWGQTTYNTTRGNQNQQQHWQGPDQSYTQTTNKNVWTQAIGNQQMETPNHKVQHRGANHTQMTNGAYVSPMTSPEHRHTKTTSTMGTLLESKKMDNCAICMCPPDNPKTLPQCKHTFCTTCIDNWFANKPTCPTCGVVYGKLTGNQPQNGTMQHSMMTYSVPGYEGHGTIEIIYKFKDGIQGDEHPNPGQPYSGITRYAYLPANDKGKKVLKLLKEAFKARMVFTVGRSVTSGRDNIVTWNDIHHKTNVKGGPQRYGYPDPTYLDRVLDELAAKGYK